MGENSYLLELSSLKNIVEITYNLNYNISRKVGNRNNSNRSYNSRILYYNRTCYSLYR